MADRTGHHPRRRTFGPSVLLGLAAAALASVAASQPWLVGGSTTAAAASTMAASSGPSESPLAAALGLVLLAAWGVLLVTRGVFRRTVAWLGVVTAGGYAVIAVAAPWQLRSGVEDSIRATTGTVDQDLVMTPWWWAALVAAVLAVVSSAAAALWVRHWPEMGTRYDAPAGGTAAATAPAESVPTDNIDIWKALDEGRDPTA